MGKPSTTDWERVEAEYRTGILTLREIADACGITEGAIRKRAKRDSWTRDLNAKINAKADELVRREQVRKNVKKGAKPGSAYHEKTIVAESATVVADIRLKHQRTIGRAEKLIAKMLAELELHTDHPDTYAEIAKLLIQNPFATAETAKGTQEMSETAARQLAALEAVLSLPERSKTAKTLVESLQRLVGMERESYGIGPVKDEAANKPPPEAAANARDHYQWLAQQRPTGG